MGGLGVRDVKDFNLALLARKCWGLFQDPSSFVSKVFKHKYYPQDEFLRAKMGYRLSFSWRSLMVGRSLPKARLFWTIGDDQNAKLWKD